MLRASAAVERAGYPTVSIVSTGFLKQAEVVARGLGMGDLKIAHYPGTPMVDGSEELKRKIEEQLLPKIVEGLTSTRHGERKADAAEPLPRDIVFRGDLEEVNDHYYQAGWTDGLPIVPPTIGRIERFLRYTDRAPDEVIGVCPPDNREATIWNIAVTGVMAGCRPEYMPLLIAIVEAVTQPEFRLQDAGSTPGWEPVVTVNGPIAKQLDFNSGASVSRIGRRANSSVGRFLRLVLRNMAGFRFAPHAGDKGSIGQNFFIALAENEDACREIGWSPYSVDRGFAAGDNVVTVQSVVNVSPPIYTGSDDPLEHARILAEVLGQSCGYWSPVGMTYSRYDPLIVMSPSIAKVFADHGWSKDKIRQHLYNNCWIAADDAERYAYYIGLTGFKIREHVARGLLPPEYAASDDPKRLVRVFQRADSIGIVVAGDAGRNQSKCYASNHTQGPPTSRRIVLPRNWNQLVR
ncbi:MAG: hypothetical protein GEV05_14590 [Betaproteobacteria bacterium]|nr:hypothetical protein [Betaproteobacteria bacterium]